MDPWSATRGDTTTVVTLTVVGVTRDRYRLTATDTVPQFGDREPVKEDRRPSLNTNGYFREDANTPWTEIEFLRWPLDVGGTWTFEVPSPRAQRPFVWETRLAGKETVRVAGGRVRNMGRQRLWDPPWWRRYRAPRDLLVLARCQARRQVLLFYGSYSQGAAAITDQTAEELVSFALAPRPTYAAAASGRYDGVWKATFGSVRGLRTFRRGRSTAGSWSRAANSSSKTAYPVSRDRTARAAVPTDNGDIRLVGTGVNSREPYRGMVFDIQFEGRLVGDRIELSGMRGSRTCTGTIARTGG